MSRDDDSGGTSRGGALVRRLSLRARLVLGVVVLSAIGLAAADIALYASLRSFLLDRVDTTLEAGRGDVVRRAFAPPALDGQPGVGDADGFNGHRSRPPVSGVDWYQIRTVDGQVIAGGFLVGSGSPPRIPSEVPTPPVTGDDDATTSLTVPAQTGGERYRVLVSRVPQAPDRLFLVAASLSDVDATLRRLLLIEALTTIGVLAAITGLGLWMVRLGLRPLREIETTAAAIADGDLSQRVERAEPLTEVGRLGLSLNAMLTQIETAFRAQEASERKLRRFVADASHELRTPLSAVRAYAELFDRGAASRPDDLARSMAGITRESERMSLLVDDLLLLAHLDEGRPLASEEVELDEVVREAADAAQVVDPDRPLTVETVPATVTGDRDRLRQLLDNLLVNVRAHTPAGNPVEVRLIRSGDTATVGVHDTGPGLTEEQAAHVFERFYRVDDSRARASGGTGLGLSIVAAIARAHGGSVAVESVVGDGATFTVTLPLAKSGS